jgi:hypothetical protein
MQKNETLCYYGVKLFNRSEPQRHSDTMLHRAPLCHCAAVVKTKKSKTEKRSCFYILKNCHSYSAAFSSVVVSGAAASVAGATSAAGAAVSAGVAFFLAPPARRVFLAGSAALSTPLP